MSVTEFLRKVRTLISGRPAAEGFVLPKTNPPFALGSQGLSPLRGVTGGRQNRRSQSGFTYIGLLIVVAVMGSGLATFGELYSRTAQREKERELLFVGNEYRQAIAAYYQKSPGQKAFPKSLEDLVEDKRFPVPQHHLRKLYRDPMTNGEWGVVEVPGGSGIMGVYSLSEEKPVKSSNFATRDAVFEGTETYKSWLFTYSPSS